MSKCCLCEYGKYDGAYMRKKIRIHYFDWEMEENFPKKANKYVNSVVLLTANRIWSSNPLWFFPLCPSYWLYGFAYKLIQNLKFSIKIVQSSNEHVTFLFFQKIFPTYTKANFNYKPHSRNSPRHHHDYNVCEFARAKNGSLRHSRICSSADKGLAVLPKHQIEVSRRRIDT